MNTDTGKVLDDGRPAGATASDCDVCPHAEGLRTNTAQTHAHRRAPAAVVALLLRAEGRR